MFYLPRLRAVQGRDGIRRRDARRLPDIKSVDNPYALSPPRPARSADQLLANGSTKHVEAFSSLPSEEWRSEFERHFRNLRGVSFGVVSFKLACSSPVEHIPAHRSPPTSRTVAEDDSR